MLTFPRLRHAEVLGQEKCGLASQNASQSSSLSLVNIQALNLKVNNEERQLASQFLSSTSLSPNKALARRQVELELFNLALQKTTSFH
jgi:hypothetical protein